MNHLRWPSLSAWQHKTTAEEGAMSAFVTGIHRAAVEQHIGLRQVSQWAKGTRDDSAGVIKHSAS
jgi:hypothetical protein